MSIQHVFLEKGGVFYFCKIKCNNSISSFNFYNIYNISPAYPEELLDSSGEQQMKEK